jgi:DNA-binding transcriptional MerR regulator
MHYRVEELAARAGIGVDTVRYYQGRGLLPPPRREGRIALYDEAHLERLQRIRSLLGQGFTLALIKRLFEEAAAEPDRNLLEALVEERVGERTLTGTEFASEAGIPEALVAAARSAGLVEPLEVDGEERFSSADLEMARAALRILTTGFPLHELLELAVQHATSVQAVADRAIDLFDRHVRKPAGEPREPVDVTAAFKDLLPQVTRLVALHFQRTVVSRALHRLADREENEALRAALAATESSSLEVTWR